MTTRVPRPVGAVVSTLQSFLKLEAAGGLVLMAAAAVAMIAANSPLAPRYESLLTLPVEFRFGDFKLAKPLLLWINDGLMAVFFFLVGMELKREVLQGHLSSLRTAALPLFAAVGGMAAPAAVYVLLNRGDAVAMNGWAVPTATDIAFALGVLSLLGPRVPTALKAFLLSVAIFDDLGAILVIAFFYTSKLSLASLGFAAAMIVGLAVLNRLNVRRPAAYVLLGIPLWVAVLKSGVHATLAGVVLAMFIPLRGDGNAEAAADAHGDDDGDDHHHGGPLLLRLEHALHPWVAFGVLPIFAFANAGVPVRGLSAADLSHPVPLGIVLGLFLGKQIGVLGLSWLAVQLRLAALPAGVGWGLLHGVALLCGIGFTMSLFIASLAFEDTGAEFLGMERLGILMGSLVSGLGGWAVLRWALGRREPA
ncbi:MAG TPA: Na+/H+ antiporter NhaA [Candidatus Krumholzibacteria bacterium]|nr:Na+/H+ antiporter NhaA [Candidatus Krumholzibacteria bacterium]HRX51867.1 Na+/H+ antiporter NhaA [Candidatus Krumholzibacteria bacterium]